MREALQIILHKQNHTFSIRCTMCFPLLPTFCQM